MVIANSHTSIQYAVAMAIGSLPAWQGRATILLHKLCTIVTLTHDTNAYTRVNRYGVIFPPKITWGLEERNGRTKDKWKGGGITNTLTQEWWRSARVIYRALQRINKTPFVEGHYKRDSTAILFSLYRPGNIKTRNAWSNITTWTGREKKEKGGREEQNKQRIRITQFGNKAARSTLRQGIKDV